jgi:hypothetical protein
MIGMVVSYNPSNGNMVVNVTNITGSGSYSTWQVNLEGAAGGDGSSGTSGTSGSSGTDGSSGTSGTSGSSGSSGTSGTSGTSGSSGSSGTSGTSGSSGTSGTSGSSGSSGSSGTSGTSGSSGSSGTSGTNGTSGTSGTSGSSGTSAPTPPFALVYGLFSQTGNSPTISGTTTESTLIDGGAGTLSVPANGFNIGDSFRADFGGVLNAANNQTLRIRVKTGSVVLGDSGVQPITNITNNVWSLSVNFTIRSIGGAGVASIVTLGTFNYAKTVNGTVEGFSFNTVNNTTFDTTATNTLDVTLEWGSTSVGNSIYSDIFVLNKIY